MVQLKDFYRIDSTLSSVIAYEKMTLNSLDQKRHENNYEYFRKAFIDALAEEQGLDDPMDTGSLPTETELGDKASRALDVYQKLLLSRM